MARHWKKGAMPKHRITGSSVLATHVQAYSTQKLLRLQMTSLRVPIIRIITFGVIGVPQFWGNYRINLISSMRVGGRARLLLMAEAW